MNHEIVITSIANVIFYESIKIFLTFLTFGFKQSITLPYTNVKNTIVNSDNLNINKQVDADDGCDGSDDDDDCKEAGDLNKDNDDDDEEDWTFWTPLNITLIAVCIVVAAAVSSIGVYFSVKAIKRVSQRSLN